MSRSGQNCFKSKLLTDALQPSALPAGRVQSVVVERACVHAPSLQNGLCTGGAFLFLGKWLWVVALAVGVVLGAGSPRMARAEWGHGPGDYVTLPGRVLSVPHLIPDGRAGAWMVAMPGGQGTIVHHINGNGDLDWDTVGVYPFDRVNNMFQAVASTNGNLLVAAWVAADNRAHPDWKNVKAQSINLAAEKG